MTRMTGRIAWLALVAAALLLFALAGPGGAAIGIYKWSAVADGTSNTATIQYFLNVNANAGSILIKDSGGAVVNTLPLAGKLSKGTLYSVTWDGSNTSGGSAATGLYTAVVQVTAPAVTATNITTTLWGNTAEKAYGIAVDTNPSNSTFGRVYATRPSSTNKRVDVYEPDGTLIKSIPSGMSGGSCPWGVAVGWNGRIYLPNRTNKQFGNYDPITGTGILTATGASGLYLIGAQPAIALNDLGGGSYSDAALYVCDNNTSAGTGNHIRRILVNGSTYAWGACAAVTPDTGANAVTGCPVGITFGWRTAGQSALWLANGSSNYGKKANGVEKWVSADGGASYTQDTSFTTPGVDMYTAGISAHPNGSWLCATRFSDASTFIIFNKNTGAVAPGANGGKASYALDPALTPYNNYTVAGSFDAFGNLAISSDNGDYGNPGYCAAMIAFPDSGSSDSRIAGSFNHVQQLFKPTLQAGAAFTPGTVPGDNSTTVTFNGTVLDKNGLAYPSMAVTGSLAIFGTSYPLTVTKTDASHFNVSAVVKAPLGQKCGSFSGIVTVQDNAVSPAPDNSGIADPPQYANVTVTGGTLSGTVKLDYSSTERGTTHGACYLRVKDKAVPGGAKDYSFTIPASANGAFSVSVHAGNFLITADADGGEPTKVGYNPGKQIDNVAVTLNATTANIEPGVAPLNIYQAKSVEPNMPMCVTGVVCAEKADTVNGYPGFPSQYYLRDSSVPGGGHDGLSVIDGNMPIEKSTVIFEGAINHPNGGAVWADFAVTGGFYTLSNPIETDYGLPDPCVVTDFNQNLGGGIDPGWGRFLKVSNVTVTDVDTTNKWFHVKDASNNVGLIDIFETTGIIVDQTLSDTILNKQVDVTGIKERLNTWGENVLRPRKIADIYVVPPPPPTRAYTTGTAGFVKTGKWNLVSLPAEPVNADPAAVFNGIDIANASFQYWKNDVDGGGYQLYGTTFGWTGPAARGIPFWFIETGAGADKDVTYEGYVPQEDFVKTVPAHAAAPFWIMFGTGSDAQVPAMDIKDPGGVVTSPGVMFKNVAKRGDVWLSWTDAFSDSDATQRIVDSNAQGWDTANSRFGSVTPPAYFGESSMFNPWWGYWMLIYDTNALEIKFPKPAN